jgi:protease I
LNVVFIVAQNGFRDEELFEPKDILESKGFKCDVASKTTEVEAIGKLGLQVKPDVSLDFVTVDNYDAFVFVGGPGAAEYFKDKTVLRLAKKANMVRKVVAAICIAPVILANAGVLEGKRATVYNGAYLKMLESKGAVYVNEPVVVDGNIVTANGPEAAMEFGDKIASLLS